MKTALLALLSLISSHLFSQTEQSTKVEVYLFLPAHIKNSFATTDKLNVYLQTFPDDTSKFKKKIIAKKIRDNVYEFDLPKTKYWFVGYNIGKFSCMMVCVDARNDDEIAFDVMLENKITDFTKVQFLPPCPRRDESDEDE